MLLLAHSGNMHVPLYFMISCSELNLGKDQNENQSRTEVPSKLGQDPTQV